MDSLVSHEVAGENV